MRKKHNLNYYIEWKEDSFIKKGITYYTKDIIEYYINQNHTREEAASLMNISKGTFEIALNHYKIKKDYSLSVALRRKTCLEKYGSENYMSTEECKEKIRKTNLEKYGVDSYNKLPEYIERRRKTCLEKYNNENYQNREQIKQTLLNKYGVDNVGDLNKFNFILEKKRETNLKNRGVEYPLQSKEVLDKFNWGIISEKSFVTKMKNNTINTSKPESRVYSFLCNRFGEKNILKQYKDERYPYHCDFYIKSLDLFIELNFFFTHGEHPFNIKDEKDLKVLKEWMFKSSASNFYKNAIEVWCLKDLEKQKIAKENKLNYLVFYKEKLVYDYFKEFIFKEGEIIYEVKC